MSELAVLRRENARLRVERIAHVSKINELEEALAFCHRRFGIDVREVLEAVIGDDFVPDDYRHALSDGDGLTPAKVADEARRLHREGLDGSEYR